MHKQPERHVFHNEIVEAGTYLINTLVEMHSLLMLGSISRSEFARVTGLVTGNTLTALVATAVDKSLERREEMTEWLEQHG